jgi:hypothetical protein
MSIEKYTDDEIVFIKNLKDEGLTWHEVTVKFNSKFKCSRSFDSVKKAYYKYADIGSIEEYSLNAVVSNLRNKRSKSITARENKLLLEAWTSREDILEAIEDAVSGINKVKKIPAVTKTSGKKNMTLELVLSDVHVGKLTDDFNHEVLKKRLDQIATTVLKEIQRAKTHYNVEKIVIAFIGDLTEGAVIHGSESRRGCEFGDSKQVSESIKLFYSKIILPIAMTGIRVDCVGVTGNHDRMEESKTFFKPGEEHLTWITYNSLKLICESAGLKNVSWQIPTTPYYLIKMYGETICYEHGDLIKGGDLRKGLETQLAKRIKQLNTPIHMLRVGHFHEPMDIGCGKLQINGSVPGGDSYSAIHGFNSEPSQTLNFYIERSKSDSIKRRTCFYKKLLLQLE